MKVFSILVASFTLVSNTVLGAPVSQWKTYQCHNAHTQPKQVMTLRVAVHPCKELREFQRLDQNPAMVLNERVCSPTVIHIVRKGQTSYPVAAQFHTYVNNQGGRIGSFRSQFLPPGLNPAFNSFQCGEMSSL